ncbi:MAG: methyl-accepting chemotaxis protein [Bdellovibrio sp.]
MNFKFSLQSKIIGLVLSIILMIGLGVWWNIDLLGSKYQKSKIESFGAIAKTAGARIGMQFHKAYKDVQIFATSEALQSGNSLQIKNKLNQYAKLSEIYDVLLVVDNNGKFIASNTHDISGKELNVSVLEKRNYSEEPWFKAVKNGKFTEDKEKGYKDTFFEPWIYDPIIKAALNEDRIGSSFTAAIKDEKGSTRGFISARTNRRWLLSVFNDIDKSAEYINTDPILELVDDKGTLLYSQDNNGKTVHEEEFLKKDLSKESAIVSAALKNKSGMEILYSQLLKAKAVSSYNDLEHPLWISSVGWHLILADHYDKLMEPVLNSEKNFYVFIGITIFIALALSIFFTVVLVKQISSLTNELGKNTGLVSKESVSLAASSTELSGSSTQQAAALQETVAAVDQIFAMVEKNADAATRSQDYSSQSRTAAEQGKHTVEQMLSAISEIDAANREISQRMETSNNDLSAITSLIKEIGSKTKVINDIVFQTKLLSFNASVEAARAGEYGKGFAVVAEEVGNLAHMSGAASKEISSLLDESVKKVDSIVEETKKRVEKLMVMNKQKVDAGSKTAHDCASALEEILKNVGNVDAMVSEIAVASREQSLGIKEISKAVGQMEQVIQKNTTVAISCSTSSEQLRDQSSSLEQIVNKMQTIVYGRITAPAPASADNVIVLQKKKFKAKAEPLTKNLHPTNSSSKKQVKVAGSDVIPSANDPGFEE